MLWLRMRRPALRNAGHSMNLRTDLHDSGLPKDKLFHSSHRFTPCTNTPDHPKLDHSHLQTVQLTAPPPSDQLQECWSRCGSRPSLSQDQKSAMESTSYTSEALRTAGNSSINFPHVMRPISDAVPSDIFVAKLLRPCEVGIFFNCLERRASCGGSPSDTWSY